MGEIEKANSEIFEIMKYNLDYPGDLDEELFLKLLERVQMKQYIEKLSDTSPNSYCLNKDLSRYSWDKWGSRLDYKFYIKLAKEKIKGFKKETNNEA